MRLEGKVAIVTGGSQGIGKAVASLMAKEGATVVVSARRLELLERAARKIREDTEGKVLAISGDVAKEEDWREIVETTVSTFGKLDILVNNAGIVRRFPLEETPLEAWNQMFTINATGIFLGTRAVIPRMKEQGGGSIVNMSSIGGIVGLTKALANNSAYQATKGAIRIFTKSTAIEYARNGIRANSVHPGVIATEMSPDFRDNPAFIRNMEPYIPLDIIGTPEDVAYGVLYLASDESSYVTGAELVIDGGMTAH